MENKEEKCNLLIVDGAGTLFDPGSVVPAYAFQEALASEGIDTELDLIMKYMGRPKLEHLALVLKEKYQKDPSQEELEKLYSIFKEKLYSCAEKTEEIPGVKESMFKLKENKIQIVMTTGYDRKMVKGIMKKLPWLEDLLSASFTSTEIKNGRPAPDLIYAAMDYVGSKNAVKVGDTLVDLQAADNAGIPGIFVQSGSLKEVTGKYLVLPSLVEVAELMLDDDLREIFK